MKTILGSETEFGLIVSSKGLRKNSFSYSDILNFISDLFTKNNLANNTVRFREANWWNEDFDEEEEIGSLNNSNLKTNKMLEIARCLGMTGDYLFNGSRFYIDGDHLEYSTAECENPLQLIAHERAGERIVLKTLKKAEKDLGVEADLLKRNWDYHKSSYACHENYLLSRDLFNKIVFDFLITHKSRPGEYLTCEQAIWVSHLISRQIFTGSGRFDSKEPWPKCLGLSQRQPFVRYFSEINTTGTRSIINTRDRPYADPNDWGRLHVICGDSNRADWSNFLKYGTSLAILTMLEDFEEKDIWSDWFSVKRPVRSFRNVKNGKTILKTNAGEISALDLQFLLCEKTSEWYERKKGHSPGLEWISDLIEKWKIVLNLLKNDDDRLRCLLDYFIKEKHFGECFKQGKRVKEVKFLDYHYNLVGEKSFFEDLLKVGEVERLVSEEEILRSHKEPPKTRAELRSKILSHLNEVFVEKSWHLIWLRNNDVYRLIKMPDPREPVFSTDDEKTEALLKEILTGEDT